MPRQNLYVKDGRSRTTSIRVNPLLYDAVRQQGGNVEDLFETALSAYLHVPPEVLVRLHREEELLLSRRKGTKVPSGPYCTLEVAWRSSFRI